MDILHLRLCCCYCWVSFTC
uniref:Uncharacterized protein n=1 Tax=Arundo donax TaxID=35708 RepID=A0A0A9BX05_ARUDO